MGVYEDIQDALDDPVGGHADLPAGDFEIPPIPLTSRTTIRGAGPGVTILRIPAGADQHFFAGDGASHVHLANMTLDCRGDTMSAGVHGIRLADAHHWLLEDLQILAPRHYGIGAQAGTFYDVSIDGIEVVNPGGDGIDFKDPNQANRNIFLSRIRVVNPGTYAATQVGVDVRGEAILSQIDVEDVRAGHGGIRFRHSVLGGRRSQLSGFNVDASPSSPGVIGLAVGGQLVAVSNGFCRGFAWGVVVGGDIGTPAEDVTIDQVHAIECGGDGIQVGPHGRYVMIDSCVSRDNGDDGVEILGQHCVVRGLIARNNGSGSGSAADVDLRGSNNIVEQSTCRLMSANKVVNTGTNNSVT